MERVSTLMPGTKYEASRIATVIINHLVIMSNYLVLLSNFYFSTFTFSADLKKIQAMLTPLMKEVSLFTRGLFSKDAPWRKSALTKAKKMNCLYDLFNANSEY